MTVISIVGIKAINLPELAFIWKRGVMGRDKTGHNAFKGKKWAFKPAE